MGRHKQRYIPPEIRKAYQDAGQIIVWGEDRISVDMMVFTVGEKAHWLIPGNFNDLSAGFLCICCGFQQRPEYFAKYEALCPHTTTDYTERAFRVGGRYSGDVCAFEPFGPFSREDRIRPTWGSMGFTYGNFWYRKRRQKLLFEGHPKLCRRVNLWRDRLGLVEIQPHWKEIAWTRAKKVTDVRQKEKHARS